MSEQAAWRIADADRLAALEALGEHYATGRLDKAEYDQRSEQVLAAKTDRDLRLVFADLPLPHGRVQPVTSAAAPRPVVPSRRRHHHGPFVLIPLVVLGLVILAGAPWVLVFLAVFLFLRFRGAGQMSGRCFAARGRSVYPHRTASTRSSAG